MTIVFTDHQERVLDTLARRNCLERGKCERCGGNSWLQWCHIFTRGRGETRWDPDNCFCLCKLCHDLLDGGRKTILRAFAIHKMGEDAYWALKRRSEAGKVTRTYHELIDMLGGV